MAVSLELDILPLDLSVCRLVPEAKIHGRILAAEFVCITRTGKELSLVLPSDLAPAGAQREDGWKALGVRGPLDFSLTGVLAGLALPLARAGISIFAISTYDTDYLLVKKTDLETAVAALEAGRAQSGNHKKNQGDFP